MCKNIDVYLTSMRTKKNCSKFYCLVLQYETPREKKEEKRVRE